MSKPLLCVFSSDERVKDYLVSVIDTAIGHKIDIFGISLNGPKETKDTDLHPDLVLATGDFIEELAKKHFKYKVPTISATRVITGYNLEKVLMLPADSRILIVSNPVQMAEEVEYNLKMVGIEFENIKHFWVGKEINWDEIDYVITPNMRHLCSNIPDHVEVINLGNRTISVKTFATILNFFGLDYKYLDLFENSQIELHVRTCRKVTDILLESEANRIKQKSVLESIDEVIIFTDQEQAVLLMNTKARQLFYNNRIHLNEHDFMRNLQAQLRGIVNDSERTFAFTKNDDVYGGFRKEGIIEINHQKYYCTLKQMEYNGLIQYIFVIKAVQQIQSEEQRYRKSLHKKGFYASYSLEDLWGTSPRMLRLKSHVMKFANSPQSVLIIGESGTGKEIVAQSIHQLSTYNEGPFVGVNFAALSDSLVESELFGYQSGAFTGASKSGKLGLFELAHGGTIFLDEIGDASLRIQTLLLRVLEEKRITRVGGEETIPIDFRVIAATNKNLEFMVQNGTFREDLYYRLNAIPLQTVPIKKMKDEIPSFINRYLHAQHHSSKQFEHNLMQRLVAYDWPGNFRELRNVLDYVFYASQEKNDDIQFEDIPEYLHKNMANKGLRPSVATNIHETMLDPLHQEILYCFQQTLAGKLSRAKLKMCLNSSDTFHSVSDYRIRVALKALTDYGYLIQGTTKQGTWLSDKGRAYHQTDSTF